MCKTNDVIVFTITVSSPCSIVSIIHQLRANITSAEQIRTEKIL